MVWCLERDWDSHRNSSALDCRTVLQRRLTSSFLPDRLAGNPITLSCTRALVPKHRFPVASALTQPDCLVCVEVRAVARQAHQPQPQTKRPQVLPYRVATMGRSIVPDDPNRPRALFPQLPQEGRQPSSRRCCCPPAESAGASIHSSSPVSRHTVE